MQGHNCSISPVSLHSTVFAWLLEDVHTVHAYGDRGSGQVLPEMHTDCIFDQLLPQQLCKLPPATRLKCADWLLVMPCRNPSRPVTSATRCVPQTGRPTGRRVAGRHSCWICQCSCNQAPTVRAAVLTDSTDRPGYSLHHAVQPTVSQASLGLMLAANVSVVVCYSSQ